MIVVDSNLVAYLLIPGDQSEDARRAYARDPGWIAPLLWRSEMRNVLALYLRKRQMTLAQASEVQQAAEELLAGGEYMVDSGQVLELAAASGHSAYDCEYVALAQAMRCRLVSADRQLVRSFPDIAITLTEFVAHP